MNGLSRFTLGDEPFTFRVEPVEAAFASGVGGFPASRGLPGGNSLFFCVAKRKVSKRKGDPMVRVPPLRCGQPAVLAENGVELELAALRQSLALIHFRLCSSAQPDGWQRKQNTKDTNDKNPECRKRKALPARESQESVMFARERSARGHMRFPSIAQRGEGGVRGGSGELKLLPSATRRRSVTLTSLIPHGCLQRRPQT